ncbi:MAG: right-handed parallel beta-helix repeat-containing protein, partial [Planctomycetota bacterium]
MRMPVPYSPRPFPQVFFTAVLGISLLTGGCRPHKDTPPRPVEQAAREVFDVHPGDDVQQVLDEAALALQGNPSGKVTVRMHAGTYRPLRQGQALIHFNRQHDGITLEGVGQVVLTAANDEVADRADASFPAVVNHVVFFGDGISSRTVLRGMTITGANGFAGNDDSLPAIEPDSDLPQLVKNLFFYLDGGAIKIFGRSYPTIDSVIIEQNSTRLCGAGASVEHRGFLERAAVFRNCVFRNNSCPGTGAAIDVLGGSAAKIENCLFVGNIANTGMDQIATEFGLEYNPEHGCGALTVFPGSRVAVSRCTFTNNWNGADDQGIGSTYLDTIFWKNVAGNRSRPGGPYELDIADASDVRSCFFGGDLVDLRGTIDPARNNLNAPDP